VPQWSAKNSPGAKKIVDGGKRAGRKVREKFQNNLKKILEKIAEPENLAQEIAS